MYICLFDDMSVYDPVNNTYSSRCSFEPSHIFYVWKASVEISSIGDEISLWKEIESFAHSRGWVAPPGSSLGTCFGKRVISDCHIGDTKLEAVREESKELTATFEYLFSDRGYHGKMYSNTSPENFLLLPIVKVVENVSLKSNGMNCNRCKEFYPYAVPNQRDGVSLVCYSCRNNTW